MGHEWEESSVPAVKLFITCSLDEEVMRWRCTKCQLVVAQSTKPSESVLLRVPSGFGKLYNCEELQVLHVMES